MVFILLPAAPVVVFRELINVVVINVFMGVIITCMLCKPIDLLGSQGHLSSFELCFLYRPLMTFTTFSVSL